MHVLMHSSYACTAWKTNDLYQSILASFSLSPSSYTIDQLRYDVRKLKAHGILQRIDHSYLYLLTDFGKKVCIIFVLFHSRIFGPICAPLFNSLPNASYQPCSKIEKAYSQINHSIDELLQLMVA